MVMIGVNYTWSTNIANTDTAEDNQGLNACGGGRGANHYIYDFAETAASATATCGAGTTATRASRCRADA